MSTAAVIALWMGVVGSARAHEPAHAVGLLFDGEQSAGPDVIVTNRGLVFVDDGNVSDTALRCSESYGVTTAFVPSVLRSPSGALLLGFYDGLSRTTDRGCSMQSVPGLVADSPGNLVRADGGVLLVANEDRDQPILYASGDEGESFQERYRLDQPGYFQELLVAPSDPTRVYAAGRGSNEEGVAGPICAVSEDAGETWTVQHVDAGIEVFAVDPGNPDVVFARKPVDMYATIFQVLRSDDACESFEVVLDMVPIPTSVSGPAEGDTRFIGLRTVGGKGGLYRSTAPDQAFERVLEDQIQTVTCLEQRGDRLWICANIKPNLEGVFTSDDGGESIEPFLTMPEVARPVDCATADERAVCAGPWYDFYSELHPDGAGTLDAGAGDAGTGDAGDAGRSDPDASPGDGDGGGSAPGGSSGCGVTPARRGAGHGVALWAGLCVCAAWFRRRRVRSVRPDPCAPRDL